MPSLLTQKEDEKKPAEGDAAAAEDAAEDEKMKKAEKAAKEAKEGGNGTNSTNGTSSVNEYANMFGDDKQHQPSWEAHKEPFGFKEPEEVSSHPVYRDMIHRIIGKYKKPD